MLDGQDMDSGTVSPCPSAFATPTFTVDVNGQGYNFQGNAQCTEALPPTPPPVPAPPPYAPLNLITVLSDALGITFPDPANLFSADGGGPAPAAAPAPPGGATDGALDPELQSATARGFSGAPYSPMILGIAAILPIGASIGMYTLAERAFPGVPQDDTSHAPLKRAFHINEYMQQPRVFYLTWVLAIYAAIGLLLRIIMSKHAVGIILSSAADVYFTIAGLLTFFPATYSRTRDRTLSPKIAPRVHS